MLPKFSKYKPGAIFNPLNKRFGKVRPKHSSIEIKFPSRLNAMAIDPSKIVTNENMVFTPGEIVFSVKIYKTVKVFLKENAGIQISENSKRKSLIKHAALITQKAIGAQDGLYIEVNNKNEIRHCGLGSSSSLIGAVACAINELYGNPIQTPDLVRYLAQNHGEEIEGEENLIQQVQCIGGSAASGTIRGGLLVVTGESQVIKTMHIPNKYKVIIGIPLDFKEQDAKILMNKEEKNLHKFLATGRRFSKEISYRILHQVLPAMNEINLKPVGDLIFDYRFKMGSIKNCSFVYPKLNRLAENLSYIKEEGIADVLSLSSVGPAFFAITTNLKSCNTGFEKAGFKTIITDIENNTYKVLDRNSNVKS